MSFFTNILSGPFGQAKLIVGALLIGAVLASGIGLYFYIGHMKTEIANLKEDNNVLVMNNKILQENVTLLKDAANTFQASNQTNEATVQNLLVERTQAVKAIETLAIQQKNNKIVITSLSNKINELLKDPKNDGPVAPVLRETVRGVQNNRR